VEVARYLARIGRGTALCSDRTHIAFALRGSVEQRASVVQGASGSEQLAVGANVGAALPVPAEVRAREDASCRSLCEAVTRANMRFVSTKTPEQQSGLVLHRARHLFIRQQTAVINAIRTHLAEFGIVASVGRNGASPPRC
jgi:hypothetical protein